MSYRDLLTPEEYTACFKYGELTKLSEHNVDALIEKEGSVKAVTDLVRKGIVFSAVAGGIPLGILAHNLMTGPKKLDLEEVEKEETLKYYQDAIRSAKNQKGIR